MFDLFLKLFNITSDVAYLVHLQWQ